jgi:L-2-hydroxyglutarate oxidase
VNKPYDITIIGGGIVGAAAMYQIQRAWPHLKLLLIEKEDELAAHQTGNNSGVIHSGIYYKPGSLKAKNCVSGRKALVAFAKEYGVKHDVCGKLIVATKSTEIAQLEKIWTHGEANGIENMRRVNLNEMKEIEPYCEGIAGIHIGCTGIIDFKGATNKMTEVALSIQPESKVITGTEAQKFERLSDSIIIHSSRGSFHSKYAVFCGGLHADRLARKDGVLLSERVVGFRGDYYELTPEAKHKVKHLIYPVPNPDFPFLGVHFTRMVNGDIECGPNAVFTFKREGYGKTDFDLRDTWDALTYSGTWRLFMKNMKFGLDEYRRAFSKRLFLKTLQELVPSLTMNDIQPGRAGVRALLLRTDGDTRDDFRIEYTDRSIHVLNAPSPAATAALAIGENIREMAATQFGVL